MNQEIIYAYTRQDAFKDGALVDLNQWISIEESPFRYPVACTSTVFKIIEKAVNNKKYLNDYEGVIWDIMYMATVPSARKKALGESGWIYNVIITGTGRKKYHDLKILCHPGDNMEPVLTIMLPTED